MQLTITDSRTQHAKGIVFMGAVFFFSGFSSLLYEVVWMRRLSLFFGSDIYSAALTLGAFMGGLMIGSLLAARYVDGLENTLIWYGLLEISIGVYALFFPAFLNIFSGQYRHIYQSFFEVAPWTYNGFRILVAVVTLVIPTTMMGATLPLVVKKFAEERKIGKYSGFFYSVNTLGALVGVLGVGFVLLPTIGITRSTWVACIINVIIGSSAILLQIANRESNSIAPGAFELSTYTATIGPNYERKLETCGMIAITLSGMAALALEVVWMRILTQSFSGAVYSFSIMLSCFLFGIAYGSKKIAETVDNRSKPVRLLGFLELMIAVCVGLLCVLTYFVPRFFSALLWRLATASNGRFGLACTSAEFLISAVLIAVPTILLGATFPVAVRICTPTLHAIGRGTARVYAANTAGAVIGALLAGLLLIPTFGSRVSLLITASVFAATGTFLLYQEGDGRGWNNLKEHKVTALVVLFVTFVIVAGSLPRGIVLNFNNMRNQEGTRIIYHGEGMAHTVDIFRTAQNLTVMAVNGTTEADTTQVQRRHFILKADLPLLLHPKPREVAVIGLGLGITLSTTARYPDIEKIQVIELSPDMVKAQSYLEDISGGVLHNPKVRVRIDDGRNFLAMSDQQFDMITADPIHPRVSGVGYLYTREYYEALKRRLRPDGVVCQWMPMYGISKQSFDVAFRTFVSVFPNASFWYVRGHGLFIATQDSFSIDFQNLTKRLENPVVKADLASINIHGAADFLSYMLLGPHEIPVYMAANRSSVLNTDDNAYLEYHTPFEWLESNKINVDQIVRGLLPYAGLDLKIVRNLSNEDRRRVADLWSERKDQLLPEMKAPWN